MNPNDGKTTQDETDERQKVHDRKQLRLAGAITPQGSGSSGRREIYRAPPHLPLQDCDFQKWTKFESLPIEQACFVLLGYEPPPLHCLRFVPDIDNPSPTLTWSRPPEYYDVLRSLALSIRHEKIYAKEIPEYQYITQHVLWPELIRWARLKKYAIPKELEDIVAKMEAVAGSALETDTNAKAATRTSAKVGTGSELDPPVVKVSRVKVWTLTKPKRFQGYTEPLYLLLEAAHIAGQSKPTARDILQAFATNQPSQIAKVIEGDSLDYYIVKGTTKTANLKAIREAITGMTGKNQN